MGALMAWYCNNIFRVLVFVFLATIAACGGDIVQEGADQQKANEVELSIHTELQVGAASQAIEEYFDRHGIAYSYDKFARRYQAIVRNVAISSDVDQAIVIYVYVDEEKRFQRAEAHDSFTAP